MATNTSSNVMLPKQVGDSGRSIYRVAWKPPKKPSSRWSLKSHTDFRLFTGLAQFPSISRVAALFRCTTQLVKKVSEIVSDADWKGLGPRKATVLYGNTARKYEMGHELRMSSGQRIDFVLVHTINPDVHLFVPFFTCRRKRKRILSARHAQGCTKERMMLILCFLKLTAGQRK